ncbi:uncharacterized protein LOC111404567 [Olea europaea var. sylvestris]|uniref:uncharacterized protein LOC111404567 n=1 Tax=Olea europaea var. sylvestris TaxID=158386 RepID=UPI000C1D73AD|nr:uncharacterized protein LOC111404567 [Olea europaea var. sylvestris]
MSLVGAYMLGRVHGLLIVRIWRLSATKMDTNEFFVVRKYAREHTCEIMHKFQDPRTIYRPTDIINDIRREYGVVMSYQKAWKAKEYALEDLMGSTENRFKYFFMALGQCIRGFRNAMRPLILVDGTTLRARYEGKLIIATCQDVNIQIYPLTFDIVDGENDLAMRWFFTKLREVIGNIENLAFMTDRGQSIINGIVEVFPEAHHGYCMYHIQGNLKTRYRGNDIVALFRRAAEVYSFEEFTKFMGEIEHKSESAWEYLSDMGVEHWWFYDRREESQNCMSVLAPAQEDRLFKTLEVAKALFVEPLDQFRFSVRCGRNVGYIVNLNDNTYTCRKFQLESFPCAYAVAVAMYRGFPPHNLCSHYYMTDFWRAAYAETIFPLPNEAKWEVPDYIVALNNLLPPEAPPRTPGRRRTSRIPSTGEFPQPLQHESY